MPHSSPPVVFFAQRSYRFQKMLVLAFILHLGIILGIGIKYQKQQFSSQVLDVRLMQSANGAEPENPEFIAENNRLGSGDAQQSQAQKQEVRTAQTQQKNSSQAQAVKLQEKQPTRVISAAQSKDKITHKPNAQVSPDLLTQSLKQIAKQTRADMLEETFKRNPRVQRVNNVNAKGTSYAYYLKLWQQAMEQYGTQRYPDAAKNCVQNDCRLRLLIAINANGTLRKLQILQSSGQRKLDEFAIETVQRTMPFAPFSNKMKEELDVLEVVRIFEFVGHSRFRSGVP